MSGLFTTQYSQSGSPRLLSVPADLRLWPRSQAEFGFFSSSPATSHQIRYGALAVLAPLCLSGLTSPPLQRASLTPSVKSSSNCRHIAPALTKKRHTHTRRERDVYYVCALWWQFNISLLTFQHVWQGRGLIYGPMQNSSTFPSFVSFLLTSKGFVCTSRGRMPSEIPSVCHYKQMPTKDSSETQFRKKPLVSQPRMTPRTSSPCWGCSHTRRCSKHARHFQWCCQWFPLN